MVIKVVLQFLKVIMEAQEIMCHLTMEILEVAVEEQLLLEVMVQHQKVVMEVQVLQIQ
tara:strand:- start:320 stop:493 length:174 start_codon:yes stop_codon:yes gene_type:complete